MVKYFFLILFAVNSLFLTAQEFVDTIYYDSNQQQVKEFDSSGFYRLISIDNDQEFQFLVKDYYPNGKLLMTGKFKSINPDRKNGEFTYYYPNGNTRKKCTYADNKKTGKYITWYENGTIKQESEYKNNLLFGTTKTWSEDELKKKYAEYKEGMKHGKFITYYPNGNIIRKEVYKNDKLVEGECFTKAGNDTLYYNYFTPPSFDGGDITSFTKWVIDKLKYPIEAIANSEEGEVKVKFTVKKTGEIKTIQITKQDKPYFNSEVLRVIASSPLWSPAIKDTDSVDVSIEVPIKFTLPNSNILSK